MSRHKMYHHAARVAKAQELACAGDTDVATGEGVRVAAKFVEDIASQFAKNGFAVAPAGVRGAYSNMNDADKMACLKELARRGAMSPVIARKKKPPTPNEIVEGVMGAVKLLYEDFTGKPTNRHERFEDSTEYKRLTA